MGGVAALAASSEFRWGATGCHRVSCLAKPHALPQERNSHNLASGPGSASKSCVSSGKPLDVSEPRLPPRAEADPEPAPPAALGSCEL